VNDATKTRLLEAAGEEFAEKGFESARIRDICRRAKANVGGVNYYFRDKQQLYLEAVLEAHRCGMSREAEQSISEGVPSERLRAFIHHFLVNVLAMNQQNTWHSMLMLREMLRPTEACETLVRETIRPKFERLQAILREICPGADERRLNALGFSVIGQCLHYRMARAVSERLIGAEAYHALDLDYLTDHIAGFTLAALGLAAPINGETGHFAGPKTGRAAGVLSN
jgi:TetR/AcrR family transcriptional regulator, regulator of cefoperazone and chloramphenicol sensitivity